MRGVKDVLVSFIFALVPAILSMVLFKWDDTVTQSISLERFVGSMVVWMILIFIIRKLLITHTKILDSKIFAQIEYPIYAPEITNQKNLTLQTNKTLGRILVFQFIAFISFFLSFVLINTNSQWYFVWASLTLMWGSLSYFTLDLYGKITGDKKPFTTRGKTNAILIPLLSLFFLTGRYISNKHEKVRYAGLKIPMLIQIIIYLVWVITILVLVRLQLF